ncbi:MAG: protein kinase domain-containing protein, partial [Betaproteobacteria bacterium]
PLEVALGIARDVAAALHFAHRRGVIHRDIKPENILLHEGGALVADFGIALAAQQGDDRLTAPGLAIGTPEYMSPEQGSGECDVDARADIYSLGCVVFEMLAGEPPYIGSNARAVLAKAILDPIPSVCRLRSGLPPYVDEALTRALAKSPADRFPSAAEFAQALISPTTEPRRTSVAVLPFANLSPDPDTGFFADGVTDDLIAQIAKISGLRVISRTSVIRYREAPPPVSQIASELGVATVVEGTVRRAGNRVRVVAQLIDATSDAHLWSETYDRSLDDVFAVQSDIALSIARALETSLTPEEHERVIRKPTNDAAAYDLYLLGRHFWNKRNDESIRKAIDCFQQAIFRDPGYAGAAAGLADAYIFAALGFSTIPATEAFVKARDAATQAIALDPSLPEAHCARGLVALHYDWDYPSAARAFERAIAVNPNHAVAHQFLAWCHFSVGDYAGAVRTQARALELDPLNPALVAESGWPFCYAGLHDRAMSRYNRALEIDPHFGLARYNQGCTYQAMGRVPEALAAYESAMKYMGPTPWVLASFGTALVAAGDRTGAEDVAERLEKLAVAGLSIGWLATALVRDALGMIDQALDALEHAARTREPFVQVISLENWLPFANTRRHSRFRALMQTMGVVPHDIPRQRALLERMVV